MTFVTSNPQAVSRQDWLNDTTTLPVSRSILGTVVGLSQQQTDREPRLWMQLQTSGGERRWWRCTQSGITLGQFLRLDTEAGTASPLPITLPDGVLERLYTNSPVPADLDRLLWLIVGLQQVELRTFMLDVLQDENIALPLVRHAASCRHHHSEPGGLLRHSVECAEWVQSWANNLPHLESELTLVATLCHDIGKTKTMTASQMTSDTGQMVPHEIMGLQILQPHLATLRKRWPRLADALLHMLSWRPSKQEPLPRLPGLIMLKHADQLSTVMDLRARAFEGYPSSFFWSKPHDDQAQRFHRIG